MHPAGEGVMAWRVRPCDSNTYTHGGTIYQNVPIRLRVVERLVYFDQDGEIIEDLRPVEDAWICTGQAFVHHVKEPYTFSQWATCDTSTRARSSVSASTEHNWWDDDYTGPIGITAGIVRAPNSGGNYILVAEPLDEAFRRGESWRLDPALQRARQLGSPQKVFNVINREPPEDLSCQSCGDCDGDIGLGNGNARYSDSDPWPLTEPADRAHLRQSELRCRGFRHRVELGL